MVAPLPPAIAGLITAFVRKREPTEDEIAAAIAEAVVIVVTVGQDAGRIATAMEALAERRR